MRLTNNFPRHATRAGW